VQQQRRRLHHLQLLAAGQHHWTEPLLGNYYVCEQLQAVVSYS
jgi:hypothetical protein